MRRKKWISIYALMLSAALALTACGSSGNSADGASSGSAASAAASSAGVSEAGAETEESESDASASGPGEDSASDAGGASAGNHADGLNADETLGTGAGSAASAAEVESDAPVIEGLTYASTMQLDYADCFHVYYYQDGYKLIDIPQSGQYLIVPEGGEKPEGLAEGVTVIYQPLDEVYLAATSAMSFFDRLDAMDVIKMSSLDVSGWAIQAPIDAMNAGDIIFAGKYSEPDYEMMVEHGCDLALESTMILHTPEVQEMIEDLDIPVMIDRSSYELEVLGRIEWIKLYGALVNKEDVAEEVFTAQKEIVDSMEDFENTGKTVAFFSVNSDRSVVVRKTQDIIPNMIEISGGKYVLENADDPGTSSASMNMSMEEFYSQAVNADYIVYNGTIVGALNSVDDLLGKDPLFAEFKAVKEGNVWTVDKTWYQDTANVANLITDFNVMLTDGDPSKLTYMKKVS